MWRRDSVEEKGQCGRWGIVWRKRDSVEEG